MTMTNKSGSLVMIKLPKLSTTQTNFDHTPQKDDHTPTLTVGQDTV